MKKETLFKILNKIKNFSLFGYLLTKKVDGINKELRGKYDQIDELVERKANDIEKIKLTDIAIDCLKTEIELLKTSLDKIKKI